MVQSIAKYNRTVEKENRFNIEKTIKDIVDQPKNWKSILNDIQDPSLDLALAENFSDALIEDSNFVRPDPISYKTWGAEGIDENSHTQMKQACSMPNAVKGALMADAHLGYGLPIGGVLALENAICPFAVGVDIACRMKVSILDMPVWTLKDKHNIYKESLEQGTRFGMGCHYKHPKNHEVLDEDWNITRVTRERKDKAREQLGTSGSGNHFVEFGIIDLSTDELGVPAGQYVALMSHSGSRNPGHSVCSHYSRIAQDRLPKRYSDLGRLAWLDMDTEAGQEYWEAMNLMGRFAAANHDVIHRVVSKLIGAQIIGGVENHHNFAWKEQHGGKEVYVHRKGATPAGKGVLGVIPGSMEAPAYIVKGLGNPDSLNSASHGAGRQLSRTKGKEKYSKNAVKNDLAKKGIIVLGFGADESPGVYKDIDKVMARQRDLVETIGKFQPKIVMMDDSGSKNED